MNYTDVFGAQTVPPSEESYASYSITGTANQFYWPEQYGGSGYLLADITELTGTAGAAIRLPVADAVSVGESFLLRNLGSNTIQVNNSAGAPAASLPAGQTLFCYVIDNTTPAGQWQIFTFGAGTSAADAVALAGLGLSVAAGKLQVNAEYRAINSSYPMVAADRGQILDATVGTLTITTPDATAVGAGFYSYIRNSSAGNLTLEGYSSQTVNGSLSVTLSPGDSVVLLSTGTDWVTVGFGRSVSGQFSEVIVNAAAGDVTLSSSDVAGRMIRVTGTATAGFTVTLPAVDNVYFVTVESGMSTYGVEFTTGSGTVVSLNANQRTVLTCDGTNVVTAITTTVTSTLSLVDGSAASPSISFSLNTNTGFFRKTNDTIGISAGGSEVAYFSPTGLYADVTGNLTGDVTGNVTGDVTGDLTGNVTGDVTGNVTGNVTGDLTGDVTGDVTGNLTGGLTMVGTILEDVYTITDGAAFEIDPGNGSIQLITLGANRTPKATNFAAGEAITLMVDDGSGYAITWTDATFGGSSVVWMTSDGVAPTLTTVGYTTIVLWKVGTQVYGAKVG